MNLSHCHIQVKDMVAARRFCKLREVHSRLVSLGFPILREIKDFGDSVNFYCADADGTQIEVYFNRKS